MRTISDIRLLRNVVTATAASVVTSGTGPIQVVTTPQQALTLLAAASSSASNTTATTTNNRLINSSNIASSNIINSSSSNAAINNSNNSSSTIITIKQESIPVDTLTGSYVDSTTFLPGSPVSSQMVNPNLVQSSAVIATASSAGDNFIILSKSL